MIQPSQLVKRIAAKLEVSGQLTVKPETAQHILNLAAPTILQILKEEIAEARRAWLQKDVQL